MASITTIIALRKQEFTSMLRLKPFAIVVVASLVGLSASSVNAQTRPNILVIFGDDIGWMNVSAFGGDVMGVQTPNIDRIAREGLRLTSF
jgi:hypothetical protein